VKNVDRMRHIPCWIAQGRFDVVTPIASAWSLHRAWPEAKLDIVADAGHASSCWIAQGRFDVVTPIASAWSLHRAWPEAKLDIVADAGHASSEPGIVDSLVRATDWAVGL